MRPETVTVTINGKKVQVPAGLHSFKELVQATGAPSTTKSFSVSVTAPASTIGGNDSYNIVGGETLTSS
jgi:hypothetical protein